MTETKVLVQEARETPVTGKVPRGYRYKIEYLDPEDPEGRRTKTWYFKTRPEAETHQEALKSVWADPKRNYPIREIKHARRRTLSWKRKGRPAVSRVPLGAPLKRVYRTKRKITMAGVLTQADVGEWERTEKDPRMRGQIGHEIEWWNSKTLSMIRIIKVEDGYFVDANKLIMGKSPAFTVKTEAGAMRHVNAFMAEHSSRKYGD